MTYRVTFEFCTKGKGRLMRLSNDVYETGEWSWCAVVALWVFLVQVSVWKV